MDELQYLAEIERPVADAELAAGTELLGFGWALAPGNVTSINVYLEDDFFCSATLGIPRADVCKLYPHYPNHVKAGFMFAGLLPVDKSGPRRLRFVIQTTLTAFSRDVLIKIGNVKGESDGFSLIPQIEFEVEEAIADLEGFLKVGGWAASEQPLQQIEVYMGGRLLGLADLNLPRSDVAISLPIYPNSSSSGFSFETKLAPWPCVANEIVVTIRALGGAYRERSIPIKQLGRVTLAKSLNLSSMLARLEDAVIDRHGLLRVRGWAVCLVAIEEVRVFVGERDVGICEKFLPREDVGFAHSNYPNSENSGFLLRFEAAEEDYSASIVRVVVTAPGGISRNLTAPLVVAAVIDRLKSDDKICLFCDNVNMTENGAICGVGWAVCATGISAVKIEVDEDFVGEAQIGLDRPDVGNSFPHILSARRSGFRYDLQSNRTWHGERIVRITAIGTEGEEHTILQPVLARPSVSEEEPDYATGGENEHLRFYIDTPMFQSGHALEPVRGFLLINGWAFARTGIKSVEVFVNGKTQGLAFSGIRREDIQAAFPDWDALLSGFAMLVPPQVVKPGRHELRVVVHDNDGHWEETNFTIDSEAAPEGPGPWQLRRKMNQAEINIQYSVLIAKNYRPNWTIFVPMVALNNDEIALLRQTIRSLADQAFLEWKLVVALAFSVDIESSTSIEVPSLCSREVILAGLEHLDSNIIFLSLDRKELLAEVVGKDGMFSLVSPGDWLGEDALLEMAVEAAIRDRPDFLYSDERRVDPSDAQEKPFFKPDWSPDLLLSTNYIGRLWSASSDLLWKSGLTFGSVLEYGEYDAVLQLTEHANSIVHVTKVLCTRTRCESDFADKQYAALQRAAIRRGISAEIRPGCVSGTWRFKRRILIEETTRPLVSIIMPSIASRGLVKITVDSIRKHTRWPNYEVIILDNIGKTAEPTLLIWKQWMQENADLVIGIDEAFNWSRFNNIGASQAKGDFLLFLNDDMEVLDGAWLEGLLEHAQRSEIGVVGPQLLYPDGRVQHAGIFLSARVGRHAFRFYPSDAPGPFGLALTQRNVISVTGACMLSSRMAFDAVGGFNEAHSIINNDLDYSLRLQRAGFRVVYTPHVRLVHHEMVSRAAMKDIYDSAHFDAEWKDLFLQGDPYFHPMLTNDYDDYLTESEPLRQFQVGHPLIDAEKVNRVLAVKVDHIGDFIAAFPAFRRIKHHFPRAELYVLAARASFSLAALEPAIDHMIEFNFFHARSEEGRVDLQTSALEELQKQLTPLRFDIAIDLRRQSDTRKILRYTGARWLAGFDQDYGCKWLDIAMEFEGDVARNFKRSHVSDSLVQFVDVVGTACSTDRQIVKAACPPIEDALGALHALPAIEPLGEGLFARPIVCVHTGAGATNKQWPAPSFAGLIDLLVGHEGVNVLIIGGPDEAEFAALVTSDVRRLNNVFSLVGKTNLGDLPIVLRACQLYIGNDSGPKHMAAALGVPTIGIHSGSVDAGEWGPMGPLTLTLRRDMTCGPCYIASAADCPRSLACLVGISVGDVFRACRRMLALRQKPGTSLPASPYLLSDQTAPFDSADQPNPME